MNRFERLAASLPWLSGLLAVGALGLAGASTAIGVPEIGLDMGARLLFLSILVLAPITWRKPRQPKG